MACAARGATGIIYILVIKIHVLPLLNLAPLIGNKPPLT
jgi:hypothetical protein